MIINDKTFGIEAQLGSFVFVFGNRNSTFDQLRTQYPRVTLSQVIQVHGDTCVPASVQEPWEQADAHWTDKSNTALCIKTADCIPVLVCDIKTGLIAAIHAGWKGVANKIVPKTIQELLKNGCNLSQLVVLIGPHIQFESFEVHKDVLTQLTQAMNLLNADSNQVIDYYRQISSEKYLVDLNSLLKKQLQDLNIPSEQVYDFHYDTKTNFNFHSYRRDQAQSGRQISFVARLG